MSGSSRYRQFVRKPVGVSFRVRHREDQLEEGELWFSGVDVGMGGAFLESQLLLEVDDELEVDFVLPGHEKPISTLARVAWATRGDAERPPGMGLQFVSLTDEQRALIAGFVRREEG